jgi:hypothetical protein
VTLATAGYTKTGDYPTLDWNNGAPTYTQQDSVNAGITNNAFWVAQADIVGDELVTNGGFDADLTVIDLKQKDVVENQKLFTKCKWSPFNNKELQGKVIYTFANGKLVFEKGKIVRTKTIIRERVTCI